MGEITGQIEWSGQSGGTASAVSYAVTAAETANTLTPVSLLYPVGHAWRYLSTAQVADAVARTASIDCATGLNNGLIAAWVNGFQAYIPAGAYKVASSLSLPGTLSSRDTRGDAFIIVGDGAGDPFSVASFTNATTIIASGTTIPLICTPGGGAGTGTGNVYIRDIRFEGNNSTTLFNVTVLSDSVMERCTFLQAGTGDGITIAWCISNSFRDVMVMNSGKVTTGGVKTGTGFNITQTGGDAGLTTIAHSIFAGWLNCIQIGDGGAHPIECTKIVDCAVQAATNGILINANTNKTTIDNLYSENISGTVIRDNGNYTTIRDCFMFPGYTIGIDGTLAGVPVGGSCSYDGNVFEMGTATCTGIIAAGVDSPSNQSTSLRDNSFFYAGGLANVVGIKIVGATPLITMQGNTFYPGTAWTGSSSFQFVDSSTALGIVGFKTIPSSFYQYPVLANGAWQPSWRGNALTAASVTATIMTLPPESIFALNEPTTATTVTGFATTQSRIVMFYANTNGKFTFTSSATVTLTRPWNSPFGTLTLWVYDTGGGVMNAWELGRSEFNGGGAVTQLTSRTTGVTLSKLSGGITMFSAAGSATAATFTVTNTLVVATDTILLSQVSGTNLYNLHVTAVAAGSFNITFYTTGGTATDAPVINFAIVKGAA